MCVFTSLRADKAKLEKRFDATLVEEESFGPKYVQNAFEFPKWPVITGINPQNIRLMNWGLIPGWMKDRESALKFRANTVNARAETIHEKPAFRVAAEAKHCLVLADGFFEFREVEGAKFPYYIRLKGGAPFAMAGLYDQWVDPDSGNELYGFSIITTAANPLMEMIHNRKKRMPAILPVQMERDWLVTGSQADALLIPLDEQIMEAWTVTRKITDKGIGGGSPSMLDPVDYPEIRGSGYSQGFLF
jgi:putative SOS response-associated peptidase YedK